MKPIRSTYAERNDRLTDIGDGEPLTPKQEDNLIRGIRNAIGLLFVVIVLVWLIATASKPVPLDRDRDATEARP